MSATPTDVLIVGGGGAGCSTALHLASRGVRCILLERGQIGGQASGVNYGGVRQQGRHPAELPLARRSREIWAKLPELVGTTCEFEVTGHLKLARNEAEEAELIAYLDVAKTNGLPLIMIGGNAIHQQYPWLGPDVAAGSLAPDDGAANPRLLSPALARAARDAGADIREFAPMTNLALDGTQFIVTSGEHEFRARYLINTAGYWGGTIAKAFGEPVPVSPLSPNMLVTEPLPYFMTPNLGVVGGDVYLRQIRRGNVIFGGGRGTSDPDVPSSRPSPEAGYAVMAKALQLVPQLAGAQVIRSWTGIDGEMPDRIPVIGPSRTTPGLFHAFGFSGHGFQLGLAIGAIMSELVLDGRTDVPLEPFRIDRFAQDESSNRQGQRYETSPHA
jgi:sarcosine oxidase, subunit beta